MPAASFLLDLLDSFLTGGAIGQLLAGQPKDLTQAAIGSLTDAVKWLTGIVSRSFVNGLEAAQTSKPIADQAGQQIEEIGSNLKTITEHTYRFVIPRSLSWTLQTVDTRWIRPLQTRLLGDEGQISDLQDFARETISWRANRVDPELGNLDRWWQWFATWPISVLSIWRDWFQRPGEFGKWAAPPLIGPLIGYLAAPEHKESRDNLTAVILQAAPDDLAVWEDAMVRLLQSSVN